MSERLGDYRAGQINFAEFDASVQSGINPVRYADTWGLRKQVLRSLRVSPADRLSTGEKG